jgi:hypothetical protein
MNLPDTLNIGDVKSSFIKCISEQFKNDCFICCGEYCTANIFPANLSFLRTVNFFKNSFDCNFPLHEGQPLIIMDGFDFINNKNLIIYYAHLKNQIMDEISKSFSVEVRTRRYFNDSIPFLGEPIPLLPDTGKEQIQYIALLHYLCYSRVQIMSSIGGMKFEEDFWLEALNYPWINLFKIHGEYDVFQGLLKICQRGYDTRKKISNSQGFLILKNYNLDPLNSPQIAGYHFVFRISNRTLYMNTRNGNSCESFIILKKIEIIKSNIQFRVRQSNSNEKIISFSTKDNQKEFQKEILDDFGKDTTMNLIPYISGSTFENSSWNCSHNRLLFVDDYNNKYILEPLCIKRVDTTDGEENICILRLKIFIDRKIDN